MSASPSEPGRPPGASPRPPGTFKVGTIAGSDVLVSGSWFLVAGLIAVLVAPLVEQAQPGLGALKYVAGVAFAVLLYLSVLLHEASHAVVARRFGFTISSITLHFLGGMTSIEGEARRPREEFAIAVVGPLTSIAVGLAALAVRPVTPDGLLLLAVEGLVVANLLVGVLNLVPGLPLDGGRVLKSVVWRITGNVHRGTLVAGWGGRLTAVALLAWPVLQEPVTGDGARRCSTSSWPSSSRCSCGRARPPRWSRRGCARRLPTLVARDLARRTLTVPSDLPLAEAVRRAHEAQAGSIVTVTAAGQPGRAGQRGRPGRHPRGPASLGAAASVSRTLEAGCGCPPASAARTSSGHHRTPAAEYLLVEEDGCDLRRAGHRRRRPGIPRSR